MVIPTDSQHSGKLQKRAQGSVKWPRRRRQLSAACYASLGETYQPYCRADEDTYRHPAPGHCRRWRGWRVLAVLQREVAHRIGAAHGSRSGVICSCRLRTSRVLGYVAVQWLHAVLMLLRKTCSQNRMRETCECSIQPPGRQQIGSTWTHGACNLRELRKMLFSVHDGRAVLLTIAATLSMI